MPTPDLRLVRRVLIPASVLIFVAGLVISAVIFFRSRPLDVKAALVSDLQSPDENPHGFGASAAATAISGLLLIPVVSTLFQVLRKHRPKLAAGGALLFGVGLGSVIAIGVLAPWTHGYSPLHVGLAFAAFMGTCGGTLVYLVAARASSIPIAVQALALMVLVYMLLGPDLLDNKGSLTSLAVWEFVLCANCGLGLWSLSRAVRTFVSETVAIRDRR